MSQSKLSCVFTTGEEKLLYANTWLEALVGFFAKAAEHPLLVIRREASNVGFTTRV